MGISTSTGTLVAGTSRTFDLAPASAITLTLPPNCRVTITESPATVAATSLGGNATRVHNPRLPGTFTYGPYPMGGSVLVENGSSSGSTVTWVRSDSLIAESATGGLSLVGPDRILPLGLTPNTVMLFGDSITERAFKYISLASSGITDNGDGTATALIATAPNSTTNQVSVGEVIRVLGSATPKFNQLEATVTAVSNSPAYSITYTLGANYADTPFTEAPQIVRYTRLTPKGWWTYFQHLANADFEVVGNCAQGGTQIAYITQILQRQYPNVSARFGFVLAGINDIYVGSRTLAQMIADMTELLGLAVQRVQHLVVFTIPAMGSSKSGWSTARMQQQMQFNRWLTQYAAGIGAIVVDSNAATSNNVPYGSPSDTNGVPSSGMVTDNTHPTAVGAYALAKAAYAKVQDLVTVGALWPTNAVDSVYYDADSKYMLDASHVLLSGTGGTKTAGSGTISGNSPDGVTVAWITSGSGLTATLTTPARTVADDGDAVGDNLVIALSGTAGALSLLRISVAATAARFAFGDLIRSIARVKLAAPTGVLALNLICRAVQSSMARLDAAGMEDTDNAFTEGATYFMKTPWLELRSVNGSLTSITWALDVWIENGANTASTIVTLAHPNVQKA